MQNGNYDILEMLKYTVNGKQFNSEDEMTNLSQYNYVKNTSLNLHQLNVKWMSMCIIFHFSTKQK